MSTKEEKVDGSENTDREDNQFLDEIADAIQDELDEDTENWEFE